MTISLNPLFRYDKPTRFPGRRKPSQFRSVSEACRGLRTEFRPFSAFCAQNRPPVSARKIPFPGRRDGEAEAGAERLPRTDRRICGARKGAGWITSSPRPSVRRRLGPARVFRSFNTGRIRDQWQRMTRPSRTPRLMADIGEPLSPRVLHCNARPKKLWRRMTRPNLLRRRAGGTALLQAPLWSVSLVGAVVGCSLRPVGGDTGHDGSRQANVEC